MVSALNFGTDGVRDIAGTPLTPEFALKLGQAAAFVLCGQNGGRVVMGKDSRISSDMLESAFAAGLCSMGIDVVLLGVISTPAVSFLMKKYGANAGVVVSASHNSFEYNGIKMFSSKGSKLSDTEQADITNLIKDEAFPQNRGVEREIGRIYSSTSAVEDYTEHLFKVADDYFRDMKVVFDCANGAASTTIKSLARKLMLDAVYLNVEPDGININDNCGSTSPVGLSEAVIAHKAKLGIALDGDADRLIIADEKGELHDGDKILSVFAGYMKEKGTLQGGLVATSMSNMGLDGFCRERDISIIKTSVGDRYVMEGMEKISSNLGGEQSGHIILGDYSPTGDGQLAAVFLMKILNEVRKPLSKLCGAMERFPQVMLGANVSRKTKNSFTEDPSYIEALASMERELGAEGRVVVRASGTEDKIRIMVEGRDFDNVNRLAIAMNDLIIAIDEKNR